MVDAGRVGPGVGRAEPHREERDRDQDHHAGGGGGEQRRALLDERRPSAPSRRDSSVRPQLPGRERASLAAAKHAGAEEAEQRRQQRQRGEHRERTAMLAAIATP